MQILVDADSPPVAVKEILFRAAERLAIPLVLVANVPIPIPRSPYITAITVPAGFDVADHRIVAMVAPGDLVITGDIPLADRVIALGAAVIDPRGELLTPENIRERLAMRDFMEDLRGTGIGVGGPSRFTPRNLRDFANQLDKWLSRNALPPAQASST